MSWAWSAPMNRPFEQGIDPDLVGILEIFRVKLDDTLEMIHFIYRESLDRVPGRNPSGSGPLDPMIHEVKFRLQNVDVIKLIVIYPSTRLDCDENVRHLLKL